ncbi:hypothetical protein TorRG33x02_097870 [Trema orientale]|uniref:DUF1985 domain-containing protein n=1 Tax=Trema orientale TaxID=63057 RepID=A0A2P5F951_TREOI|nr:hypothetical protein TorRG33x02_097870 [Trema orientale]
MKIMSFSGQLLHQLTLRLAKCQKKNELWFSIGQKLARFSLNEFALITGLQCGAYPEVWAYEAIPLVASKFAIKEGITVSRIIGWDAKLKPSSTEIDDVLNSNNQLIVMPVLLPRVNELTQPFFTTMASLGKDRVDEVIDQIIHDLDKEDGAFIDNMMEENGGENLDKINESEAVKVASNENIFLEDVHIIPKNSYLTRDEFETRMILIEERFQVENSQLKRTIGKLEEKIDLLIDIMLKKGGEKVGPFSDDCFHHDIEICGSGNEDIEAVIHSTARKIPDSPKTPTSLVYSDDDNFQNPSSPESCEIKFPEGRGHRFRKRSKVYRSPYTCPSKRRKLKDPIDFDPFRPLDRAKADDFCTWIKNYKPGGNCGIFAIKHIEFLSAGLILEKVTDNQIAFFRAEMATEIFALDFDP